MQVNRYLTDKQMDHIDHALGRPINPLAETYRNRFTVEPDSDEAAAFRASPNWSEGRTFGGMTTFQVTTDGRHALRDHLRAIRDPHRAFDITFEGFTETVIAKTRSEAKYDHWLRISDCDPDLTFGDYLRNARVRAA